MIETETQSPEADTPVNWAETIATLVAQGYRKADLARLCKVTPPTISDLSNGVCKKTDYRIGFKLLSLLGTTPPGDLQYAEVVAQHGGPSALARKLGINPTAVINWGTRGIPKSWQRVLRGDNLALPAPVAPPSASTVTLVVAGLKVTITVEPMGQAA